MKFTPEIAQAILPGLNIKLPDDINCALNEMILYVDYPVPDVECPRNNFSKQPGVLIFDLNQFKVEDFVPIITQKIRQEIPEFFI